MKGMLIFNYPQALSPERIDPVLKRVKELYPDWDLVVVPSFETHSTAEFCECADAEKRASTGSDFVQPLKIVRGPRGSYKPRKKSSKKAKKKVTSPDKTAVA